MSLKTIVFEYKLKANTQEFNKLKYGWFLLKNNNACYCLFMFVYC